MGYLYLIIASLMWSFVGVMVKSAANMVDSSVITLCRFLFGAIFLVVFMLIRGEKPRVNLKNRWIWIGIFGKSGNYIFENIAITIGFAYGNVVVWPVQAIFLAFVSVLLFKEELYPKKIAAVLLCISGVILISWRGIPLKDFSGANLIPLGLFILAGIGAAIHVTSQKKLIHNMDSLSMNLSVFMMASIITAVPVPFTAGPIKHFSVLALLSLIGLGLVTGISFYLNAEALKRIPFMIAVTISNSCVLFTLIWARLFYHEDINSYMIAGAVTMLAGLVLINIPRRIQQKEDAINE